MNPPINYLAVVVAALANYVIGAIWYAALFRKAWAKLMGMAEMKVTVLSVVLALVGAFFMSWVLDHAIIFAGTFMKIAGVGGGLEAGFFNWLGFIAPVTLGIVIYEKKSWALWLLNNGYWLVSLLVMGIILSVWT
ncbi:MAG TPA: DUF1761 domain-containing protein [Spirochaetia bacterium]|nr:DUF1761 domain-containing protein [Spirochaetia bacterium]